jgi:sterol desaturase/sphingolipid hydroxylase (fatty acid hydroxylase superfamily)
VSDHSATISADTTDYDVDLTVIFDEHPWLEFALDPVVEVFGSQFDYGEIGLSLALTFVCLLTVYLLFLPQRVSFRSFWQTTLPARVYLHPSARIDYICLFVYPALLTLLSYAGIELVSRLQVSTSIIQSLDDFGALGIAVPEHFVLTGIVFVVGAIIGDFSQFAVHVLYHRVPALWEFHKAHHSAKVLTPFTGVRDHPVIFVIDTFAYVGLVGLYVGVLEWIDPTIMERVYVWQASAIAFQLYFLGFLTSHYHLPVSFGIFDRVLVSPAYHMVHHVNHPDFYDKNFGHIFSFWDRLFGTDASPITDTDGLVLGLSPDEERLYDGVIKLHLAPFIGLYRMAKKNLTAMLKGGMERATSPRLFSNRPLSILSKPSN